jgi:D-glycero-D-manno-heptose 1,7-bisphosphate phosphatase
MATVFLDRDDTLIACSELPPAPPPAAPGDLVDPSLVHLLPGVLQACREMVRAGHRLVVVSNQGGIARGAASIAEVEEINLRLDGLLRSEVGDRLIEAYYFCPFHPKGSVPGLVREHDWRKPGGGMLRAAACELGVRLADAWIIGDAERDVESGIAAGLDPARCLRIGPDEPWPDLLAASAEVEA